MILQIEVPPNAIAAICQRHHIRRLALFGSVLRPDFHPGSDVDVLIEFNPGESVTYFDLVNIQDELATLLGYPVDVGTPEMLSPYITDRVRENLQVVYENQ